MKIPVLVAQLFDAEGQTTKQIIAFRNFSNAPENVARTQDESYFCTNISL